jgi:hypothetical protein
MPGMLIHLFAALQAALLLIKRGFDDEDIKRAVKEDMPDYYRGTGVFNREYGGPTFNVLRFWEKVHSEAPVLYKLAKTLYSLVPHAGPPERLFSMLGWIQSDRRNRLTTYNFGALAKLRTHYQQMDPR